MTPHFTRAAHQIEVGDRLIHGTVTAIRPAASPQGRVTFTLAGGDQVTLAYGGTATVLTGLVAG